MVLAEVESKFKNRFSLPVSHGLKKIDNAYEKVQKFCITRRKGFKIVVSEKKVSNFQ